MVVKIALVQVSFRVLRLIRQYLSTNAPHTSSSTRTLARRTNGRCVGQFKSNALSKIINKWSKEALKHGLELSIIMWRIWFYPFISWYSSKITNRFGYLYELWGYKIVIYIRCFYLFFEVEGKEQVNLKEQKDNSYCRITYHCVVYCILYYEAV